MLRLRVRDLTGHPLRTAAAAGMVAVCSALVVAVVGLVTSIRATADQVADLAAGTADVEIAAGISGGRVPTSIVIRAGKVPGVAATAHMVEGTVAVDGYRALILGAGGDAAEFLPESLMSFMADGYVPVPANLGNAEATDAVLVSASLAATADVEPGDEVSVQGRRGVRPALVAGVLPAEVAAGDVLIGGDSTAARLRGGSYDRVLVRYGGGDTEATRARLEELVSGRAVLLDPGERAEDARIALEPLVQPLLLLAGLALTVAGALVFNIVSLAVAERRRHLAIECALGARRKRLWRGLVAEAATLGTLGGLAGAVGGRYLTAVVVDQVPPSLLNAALPTRIEVDVPLVVQAAGVVVGAVAAGAAAAVAGLPVLRLSPLEAMGPRDVVGEPDPPVRPVPVVAGAAAVVTGTVLLATAPLAFKVLAALVVLDGIVVLAWALRGPLARMLAAACGGAGAPGLLAGLALERSPARTTVTALGSLLPVAAVVALGGLQANLGDTAERALSSLATDDVHVSAQDFSEIAQDLTLPDGLPEELAALDGVRSVDRARFVFARVGGSEVFVEGVEPGTSAPIVRLASPEARRRMEDGAAVVNRAFARRQGVEAGESFTVLTQDGPVAVPVAEVVDVLGWPAGSAAVSYDRLAGWTGDDAPAFVSIRTDGPAADRAVHDLVRERTAPGGVRPDVVSGDEALDDALLPVAQSRALFSALQGVLMAAGAFAVVSTLVVSTMGRTRELGLLRAVGARRRLVRRAVAIEAFAVTLVGAAAGVVVGTLFQYVTVRVATSSLGLPAEFAVTPGPVALTLAVSLAIAAVGTFAALRRALRVDVLDAVAYE